MKNTLTGILVLILAGAAWASPIGVYVDDDFTGSSLDTNEWNVNNTSFITVADSKLTLVSPGNWSDCAHVWSKDAVLPDAGQTVILTATGMETDQWAATPYWGLVGSGNNKIQLLRGDAGDGWGVYVDIGNDSGTYRAKILAQHQMTEKFEIIWSPGLVVVERNDEVVFSTSIWGGAGNIPTATLSADFLSWGGARLAADTTKLEVVPEPATLSLLAAGGLLAVLRKRR